MSNIGTPKVWSRSYSVCWVPRSLINTPITPFHPNRWWWCTTCSILAVGLPMLGRGNCERRRWVVTGCIFAQPFICPSQWQCTMYSSCTCCMVWSVWRMYTVQSITYSSGRQHVLHTVYVQYTYQCALFGKVHCVWVLSAGELNVDIGDRRQRRRPKRSSGLMKTRLVQW